MSLTLQTWHLDIWKTEVETIVCLISFRSNYIANYIKTLPLIWKTKRFANFKGLDTGLLTWKEITSNYIMNLGYKYKKL